MSSSAQDARGGPEEHESPGRMAAEIVVGATLHHWHAGHL